MSTILYEDEKFLRIYATMNLNGTAYAYLFGYPEGWQTSMSQHYQPFLDNLRIANIRAYNDRYDDADELPYSLLDFTLPVSPYASDIEFYKSLLGLRYNLDEQDVSRCRELLNRLIDEVAYSIISQLPTWEKVPTW